MISSMCRLSMNLTPALRAVYSTEREMTKPPLMQLGAPRESARAPGPPQIWVQGLKSDCLSSSALPASADVKIGRASCREREWLPGGGGSSRRRHTRLVSDWSSDVCSSDLHEPDASLAGGVFNGAGDDEAAPYAVRSTKGVGPRAGATADLGAGVEE